MPLFQSPMGNLQLERVPSSPKSNDPLRAWDAADEFLLGYVQQNELLIPDCNNGTIENIVSVACNHSKVLSHPYSQPTVKKYPNSSETNSAGLNILVVNDAFGALCCALMSVKHHLDGRQIRVHNWSDSLVAHLAAEQNLASNGHHLCQKTTTDIQSDEAESRLPDTRSSANEQLKTSCVYQAIQSTVIPPLLYDLILIKVPKVHALLEFQLSIIRRHCLKSDSQLIGAGMVRHIHRATLNVFEKQLGSTSTSLARKKARLIFSHCEEDSQQDQPSEYPYPTHYRDPLTGLTLSNHAALFSRESLDIGARFMIENFAHLPPAKQIIDLGCGNGVLGIMAKRYRPDAGLTFIDESYMAIDSARTNYTAAFSESGSTAITSKEQPGHDQQVRFILSNCLDHYPATSPTPDLILCNPPFHQSHAVGDQIAWQMFKQSRDVLASSGQLWVIANRHLGYHAKLKRLFGNCRTLAANKKFVILVSRKNTRLHS